MSKDKDSIKHNAKTEASIEDRRAIAEFTLSPEYMNNKAMLWYQGEPDEACQLLTLEKQCKSISEGDLSAPEAMLWSQAQLLNHVTARFARRLMDGSMPIEVFETYSNIMLRAQNQTRRTLDSLANLKRPRYQVQNNRAMLQQVVNELPKEKFSPNELLEVNHDARLDTGTPQEAVRSDTAVETVGEGDRPKDCKR